MIPVEVLKEQICAAVIAETSPSILEQVQKLLVKTEGISPELEARLAEGIKDLDEGRFVTLQQFIDQGEREAVERAEKFKV